MPARSGAIRSVVIAVLMASSVLLAAAPTGSAAEAGRAVPADARGCPPVRAAVGRDLRGELFPSGFSYSVSQGQLRFDFVENEYELPTLMCQSGLTTDPATGMVEIPAISSQSGSDFASGRQLRSAP